LAGWLWAPFLATAAAAAVEVPPGGVVRWAGEGIERCGMESNEWPALAGACWYAVDLLHTPGELRLHRWVNGERQTATVQVADYPYPVQHIEIEDEGKVNLSSEDLARARRESAAVGKLWSRRTPARFTLPLAPPLADLPAGGRFGSRRFFNGQPRSPHTGADYAATAGTPVRAVADGTVVLSADHFFSGNSIFIDHGDGLISMSFHLSRRDVQVGDEVHRGQVIGTVGATGRATGPHLHFGLRWRGARVDPALLLAPPERLPTPGG
jgi:murein DD-endopeptidase MepM/ murein hydrolase activator NlpD